MVNKENGPRSDDYRHIQRRIFPTGKPAENTLKNEILNPDRTDQNKSFYGRQPG